MNPLIAKVRARREHAVPLDGGKSVTVRRPAEAEFGRVASDKAVDLVADFVVGWQGFTEADLLGPEVGASDIDVPFDADLWREVVRDRIDWVKVVAQRLGELVTEHVNQRGLVAKN